MRFSEEGGFFGARLHQPFRTNPSQTIGVNALRWYVWPGHSRRRSHSGAFAALATKWMPSWGRRRTKGQEMKLFRPTALLLWAITLFGATLLGFLALERTGSRSTRRAKSRNADPTTTHEAESAPVQSAHAAAVVSASGRTRHGRFSGRTLLVGALTAALLCVGVIAPVLAASDIESCTPSTCTIEEWSDERNHEVYWETRFGMDCTKVNSEDTPVHLETAWPPPK